MTIRFAAAKTGYNAVIARTFEAGPLGRPINDNGTSRANDPILAAALRHFARHGMCAARIARDYAEQALTQNDDSSYDWWLGICRALDRRMAATLAARQARFAPTG